MPKRKFVGLTPIVDASDETPIREFYESLLHDIPQIARARIARELQATIRNWLSTKTTASIAPSADLPWARYFVGPFGVPTLKRVFESAALDRKSPVAAASVLNCPLAIGGAALQRGE